MKSKFVNIIKKYYKKENLYYRVIKESKKFNFLKINLKNNKIILYLNSNWGLILIKLSKNYPFISPDIYINFYNDDSKNKIFELFLLNLHYEFL